MEQISYKQDYYAWINQQTELLRQGETDKIDWNNVLDEFQSLAFIEYNRFNEPFYLLIGHLLIWQWYHPKDAPEHNSLCAKIQGYRLSVKKLLRESPSLKTQFLDNPEWFYESWEYGRLKFGIITDIAAENDQTPEKPIWTVSQILDEEFYPEIRRYG